MTGTHDVSRGRMMKNYFIGFGLGVVVGLVVAGAFFSKIGGSPSQVHRVSVSYPSRWNAGEFRNCRLGHPHYSGDRWPNFDCDGRGSQGEEAIGGAHAFVMDVRFSGEYKVPTDDRVLTWTCQSSATGELTCKDWQ